MTLSGLRDIKRQLLSKVWNQQVMDCSFVNIETHMERKKNQKKNQSEITIMRDASKSVCVCVRACVIFFFFLFHMCFSIYKGTVHNLLIPNLT